MQATHGSAGTFRSRVRPIGLVFVLVLALGALVFAPAANAINAPETDYLALGDSLAFGYTQEKFEANFPTESPAAFEEGYAHFFAAKLRSSSKKFNEPLKGLVEINNGCPGETTDSLIGNGPLGIALDPEGQSPCGYHKAGFPLHHEYGGVSQLENGLGVLAVKGSKIKAVTLNIGSNDELASVHKCEKEVGEEYGLLGKSKYGETPAIAVRSCIAAHAKETFEHIIRNIGRTVYAIDNYGLFTGAEGGAAKYTGPIVLLGFYNPDAFILPGSDALQRALNQAIEGTFFSPTRENPVTKTSEPNPNYVPNMRYANPFPKINPPKEANEKLAIAKYTEMCNAHDQAVNEAAAGHPLPPCDGDIHPTKVGYELLGRLIYLVYNPAL